MKILLTGVSGYVGGIINNDLRGDYSVVGVNKATRASGNILCDLADYESVKKLKVLNPDVIIHASGNKDIRHCEDDPTAAYEANTLSLINLIRVFGGAAKIIYLSTDYVFEGNKGNYTETDKPHPLTAYGRSKLNAEIECLQDNVTDTYVLRVSALYDIKATFPKYILGALEKGKKVECYSNIYYSPTYYEDFTLVLRKIIETSALQRRIYHSCGDRTSRYEFARELCNEFGYDESLIIDSIHNLKDDYLFHDLSLKNTITEAELRVKKSKIQTILGSLHSHYEEN